MATKITITEALAEVQLIKKKLEVNRSEVKQQLIKPEHVPDPYGQVGGMAARNLALVQSISDLEKRLVTIRSRIAAANISNTLTVSERTQSIHDWLTWKREVLPNEKTFLTTVIDSTRSTLKQAGERPSVWEKDGEKQLVKFTTMVDIPKFVEEAAKLSEIEERLDGQLSLKNATIVIEI